MDANVFGAEYAKAVKAYVEEHDHYIKETMDNDKVWKVYVEYTEQFCMTPSPRYRLPTPIVELIASQYITKLFSYGVHFGIDYKMDWVEDPIEEVWGVDHANFTEFVCHNCDANPGDDLSSMWVIPYACVLCDVCYDAEQFRCTYGCPGTPTKSVYTRYNITDFNATDWVKFMWDDKGALYVNCNPDSSRYGTVSMFSCNEHSGFFNNVGTVDRLLAYIHEWLAVPFMGRKPMDVMKCLNTRHFDISYKGQGILRKYGIKYGSCTTSDIINSIHKINNPTDYATVMESVNEKLMREMLGSRNTVNIFSCWLQCTLDL